MFGISKYGNGLWLCESHDVHGQMIDLSFNRIIYPKNLQECEAFPEVCFSENILSMQNSIALNLTHKF